MKLLKPAVLVGLLLGALGALAVIPAAAQHGRGGGGHAGGGGGGGGGGGSHGHGAVGGHGGAHFSGRPGVGHVGGHVGYGGYGGYVRSPRYVRRGAWVGGVVLGAPLLWPSYGYAPYDDGYYYAPAPPSALYLPPDLPPAGVAPGVAYWYYCERPRGYYPDVAGCTLPWRVITGSAAP